MRAEAELFAARVTEAEGFCQQRIWPNLVHGYWIFPQLVPEARESLRVAGRFVRDAVHNYNNLRKPLAAPPLFHRESTRELRQASCWTALLRHRARATHTQQYREARDLVHIARAGQGFRRCPFLEV